MIDATDQKIYSDQTKKQTITQATASSKRASEYLELLNKTKAQKQVIENKGVDKSISRKRSFY